MSSTPGADYGIDAPGVIRHLRWIGSGLLITGLAIYWTGFLGSAGDWLFVLFFFWAASALFSSGCMFLYSKFGKSRHRDRMLGMVDWKGDERVLDIGTGRGLLMIGAARKLTTGKATGIDIWNSD